MHISQQLKGEVCFTAKIMTTINGIIQDGFDTWPLSLILPSDTNVKGSKPNFSLFSPPYITSCLKSLSNFGGLLFWICLFGEGTDTWSVHKSVVL